MSVKWIDSMLRATERTRARFSFIDSPLPHFEADSEFAALDLRVTLDAPAALAKEVDRLRRLVRRHGGRP